MNVVLFGGSGMIGQAVLRECLRDAEIDRVVSVLRRSSDAQHPKLREVVHHDFLDFTSIEPALAGADACFWALGITSAGMTEQDYRRVTCDYVIAAAQSLLRVSPEVALIFVSGAGSDSSERGRVMWARVKGAAENALLSMPLRRVHVVRPAIIQPRHGIRSRTVSYRILYTILAPVLPLLRAILPQYVTTTDRLARAMIHAAKHGAPKPVLESADLNALAEAAAGHG